MLAFWFYKNSRIPIITEKIAFCNGMRVDLLFEDWKNHEGNKTENTLVGLIVSLWSFFRKLSQKVYPISTNEKALSLSWQNEFDTIEFW